MKTKHIAMWACPITRSSAIRRVFEQIDDCIVYDEPFLDLSCVDKINYHNIVELPSNYLPNAENSYSNIIKKLIGNFIKKCTNIDYKFKFPAFRSIAKINN